MKKATLSVVLFVCATLLAGCGGGSGPVSPVAPTRTVVAIAVIGPNQLQIGEPSNFSARAKWSDGAEEDVTSLASWNAIPAGVASTTAGVVRAAQPGSLQITAVYSGVSGVMQVEVMPTTQPEPSQPVFDGSTLIELISPVSGSTLSYTPAGQEPELQVQLVYRNLSDPKEVVYLYACLVYEVGYVIPSACNELNLNGRSNFARLTLRPTIQTFAKEITRTTKVVTFMTQGRRPSAQSNIRLAEADIKMFGRSEMAWTFNWR